MNPVDELKSIKIDIRRLLERLDYGNKSSDQSTINPPAGDILSELCFKRGVLRKRNQSIL